jgi:ATP-dependent Lon protease
MPGRIVQALKQAKSRNPVILLDEVDKLGVSLQGDPSSALLEVLDPAQNHEFTDHYLGVPFDLSEVLFIATANYTPGFPAPLYDRMEPVEFRGYTEQEKKEIAERYLIPRQREEAGFTGGVPDHGGCAAAGDLVVHARGRRAAAGAGDRQAGAEGGARIAAGKRPSGRVGEKLCGSTSAVRGYTRRRRDGALVGVATGMYYTPMGGDIMFIEVSAQRAAGGRGPARERDADGRGSLVLTGQLGDVMKESARAALTYARANAVRFGLDPGRRGGRRSTSTCRPARSRRTARPPGWR